jgi:hypothetical protein
MKTIKKDELYRHVGRFLKSKGIELTEGSYTKGIHAGCSMLADAINLSQNGIQRAKDGLDRNLDKVRQVIHEKTAPKTGPIGGAATYGVPPVIIPTAKVEAVRTRTAKRGKPAKKRTRRAKHS